MEVLKTTIERKKRKKETLTKLDLEKPNEYTNWDFLDHVMARKGFGSKWRTWTCGCLVTSLSLFSLTGCPEAFSLPHEVLDKGTPYLLSFSH